MKANTRSSVILDSCAFIQNVFVPTNRQTSTVTPYSKDSRSLSLKQVTNTAEVDGWTGDWRHATDSRTRTHAARILCTHAHTHIHIQLRVLGVYCGIVVCPFSFMIDGAQPITNVCLVFTDSNNRQTLLHRKRGHRYNCTEAGLGFEI